MVALMPISTLLPMVHPCRVAWWVIEQCSPITTGRPGSVWIITKSCTFVNAPISTCAASLRMAALIQMLDPSCAVTRP
jgi:hypothetical protein